MEQIELQLLAIDFKDTTFTGYPCAIEKAVKRQLSTLKVQEWVDDTLIDEIQYKHKAYGLTDFTTDKALASMLPDEEIVRVITLTKV